jgi:hypothetical protein
LTRKNGKAMSSPPRRARSEPRQKSAGLHLRRRLRPSHDQGPSKSADRATACHETYYPYSLRVLSLERLTRTGDDGRCAGLNPLHTLDILGQARE